jgi:hypothetical protein
MNLVSQLARSNLHADFTQAERTRPRGAIVWKSLDHVFLALMLKSPTAILCTRKRKRRKDRNCLVTRNVRIVSILFSLSTLHSLQALYCSKLHQQIHPSIHTPQQPTRNVQLVIHAQTVTDPRWYHLHFPASLLLSSIDDSNFISIDVSNLFKYEAAV